MKLCIMQQLGTLKQRNVYPKRFFPPKEKISDTYPKNNFFERKNSLHPLEKTSFLSKEKIFILTLKDLDFPLKEKVCYS